MTYLYTAFDSFGGMAENPTRLVGAAFAETLGKADIRFEVMPTQFVASGERLKRLLGEDPPQVLVMLGVNEQSSRLELEHFACNIQAARIPDNAGYQPLHQPVVPDGPAAYTGSLPEEAILRAWRSARLPCERSYSAGTFVCNHLFYTAKHWLDQHKHSIPCGFIHLPALSVLPLERQVLALTLLYQTLCRDQAASASALS